MREPKTTAELPHAFRERADDLRAYAPAAAHAWEEAARWLEQALAHRLDEILSVARAAAEFHWNYEALRRRISSDERLNAGTSGAPAIRRADMVRLGPGRAARAPAQPAVNTRSRKGAAPESENYSRIVSSIRSAGEGK